MYILGYIPNDNRLYLSDKELHVVSFQLLLSVLEYQTAVMRRDFETADKVLPTIPKEQRTRVAHFLEKQGFKQQALAVSIDPDHKFELAVGIGNLDVAYTLAKEINSEQKWKDLADLATEQSKLDLAQECLHNAQDFGGLLLLATASGKKVLNLVLESSKMKYQTLKTGNSEMITKLANSSNDTGKNNVSFLSYFLTGDLEACLNLLLSTNRLPEAAFFARTYMPSRMSEILGLWKENIGTVSEKASRSLADPKEYPNLFPEYQASLDAEAARNGEVVVPKPVSQAVTFFKLSRCVFFKLGNQGPLLLWHCIS